MQSLGFDLYKRAVSKLSGIRARRLVSALKRLGFYTVRQKGSHLQLKRGNLLVTVPMHTGDVPHGVLRSILRQARLSLDDLYEVL